MQESHSMVKSICTKYPFITILFVWLPGKWNSSDLKSKLHQNLPLVLNTAAWQNGDESFIAKQFNSNDSVVYASMSHVTPVQSQVATMAVVSQCIKTDC